MSRIGKKPVVIPSGVEVKVADHQISIKGKLGTLYVDYAKDVDVTVENGKVVVKPIADTNRARAVWGLVRKLVSDTVIGVSEGYKRTLDINGVGYRASVDQKILNLSLGFSHEIKYAFPEDIKIECPKPTQIDISGSNRQKVGQIAAEIRAFRGPEPYKGKGVKYAEETIIRKEGKKK